MRDSKHHRYMLTACFAVVILVVSCRQAAPEPQPTATVERQPTNTPIPIAPTATATAELTAAPTDTASVQETFTISPAESSSLTFVAQSGDTVRVDVERLEGAPEYELAIVDLSGNALASLVSTIGLTVESIDEFTAPLNGEYTVRLTGVAGQGNLRVAISPLEGQTGGGDLTSTPAEMPAQVSERRVYHTYRFFLTAGLPVTIAARAAESNLLDLRMSIYDPAMDLLAEADDTAPPGDLSPIVQGFVAPVDGTYTAIVSNLSGSQGDYTFSIEPADEPIPSDGEPDIVYGNVYAVQFFDGSDLPLTFDGVEGDVLSVVISETTAGLDIDIYVLSPFGQIVAFAVDAPPGVGERLVEFQLPYTGRFIAELRPRGDGQASFAVNQLELTDLTGGGDFAEQTQGAITGRLLEPDVFHYYQFTAEAGDTVSVIVESTSETGQLDLGFSLLGPSGQQLEFVDSSSGDNPTDPALTGYSLPQTGTYTIVLYSFTTGTGRYEIRYSRQ